MTPCARVALAIQDDARIHGWLAITGPTSYGHMVAVHPSIITLGRVQIMPDRLAFGGDPLPDDFTRLAWQRWREEFARRATA